jgi:hypothetical protein
LIPTVVDFSVSSVSQGKSCSDKVFMTFVYNNARISVYEMAIRDLEAPRLGIFKLVRSSALNRFQNILGAEELSQSPTKYTRCIHKESNQTLILFNNLNGASAS